MHVWSLRSTTIKFACVLALSFSALAALMVFVPSASKTQTISGISYANIYTNSDRVNFISQFGWTVDQDPIEEIAVTVPSEFDSVYESYNDLQRAQGLNLLKYRGKEIVRYTYEITNYADFDGTVYINLLVSKNKIIGGDICSADGKSFVCGFSGEKI